MRIEYDSVHDLLNIEFLKDVAIDDLVRDTPYNTASPQ